MLNQFKNQHESLSSFISAYMWYVDRFVANRKQIKVSLQGFYNDRLLNLLYNLDALALFYFIFIFYQLIPKLHLFTKQHVTMRLVINSHNLWLKG